MRYKHNILFVILIAQSLTANAAGPRDSGDDQEREEEEVQDWSPFPAAAAAPGDDEIPEDLQGLVLELLGGEDDRLIDYDNDDRGLFDDFPGPDFEMGMGGAGLGMLGLMGMVGPGDFGGGPAFIGGGSLGGSAGGQGLSSLGVAPKPEARPRERKKEKPAPQPRQETLEQRKARLLRGREHSQNTRDRRATDFANLRTRAEEALRQAEELETKVANLTGFGAQEGAASEAPGADAAVAEQASSAGAADSAGKVKRGLKRTEETVAEKKERKMAANRASAARSRKKKKEELESLQIQLEDAKRRIKAAQEILKKYNQ